MGFLCCNLHKHKNLDDIYIYKIQERLHTIVLNLSLMDYIILTLLYILVGSTIAVIFHILREQKLLRNILPYEIKKQDLKILAIVAGDNIKTSELEKGISFSGIQYNLIGFHSVTKELIVNELDKGYNIAEISSHGLNGKFALGLNDIAPISWLSNVIKRRTELQAVLLLYCNSYMDIDTIASSGVFCVGLYGEVPDTSAIIFSRQFYYYLSRQHTFEDAFDRARLTLPIADFSEICFKDGRK